MIGAMPLFEVVARFLPECHGRPQESWEAHAARLWCDEPEWMRELTVRMIAAGWFDGPVVVDDGFVQDGHHRIAAGMALNRGEMLVPVEASLAEHATMCEVFL